MYADASHKLIMSVNQNKLKYKADDALSKYSDFNYRALNEKDIFVTQ